MNRRHFLCQSAMAVLGACSYQDLSSAQVREDQDLFALREHKSKKGELLVYRLFTPKGYDKKRRYPLTLWLHGSGGDKKIYDLHSPRAPVESRTGLWRLLALPENQAKHEAFALVPRCSPGERWDALKSEQPSITMQLVLEVLNALQDEFSIDSKRLSVIGASLGGFGAWDIIAKRPGMFAAAIPICGGGDPSKGRLIAKTPVWAFHGDQDKAVNVEKSREMIAAIRKAGGNPKYTEYKGVGHNSWERAYAEPDLLPWISRQKCV